jgi:hypothetical protein
MKNFVRIGALLAIVSLACPAVLQAEEAAPFTGWRTASTAHFRFVFEDATRRETEGFAKIADNAWNRLSEIYGTPPEKTDVIVTGRTDIVNAYAEGVSHSMTFFTTPPATPVFGFREDWQTLFFTHELTHVANLSFEGKSSALATVFGPIWNIGNFMSLPGWSLEGLTTVLETELTAGGRGRSPYFELYYKAPTLDNAFMKFADIGKEAEPPRGQIYVMGYLLMRSIADRYGVGALADIERNRTGGRSFADSVRLVTGSTPDELFMDVRKALAKKYARERAIGEGITISPRKNKTYYYRPALVVDGKIVAIREEDGEKTAAVRFDPERQEETILFRGNFPDEFSLAAATNGTVVASLPSQGYDRMPGICVSTDLYTWTEKDGLHQLTSGTSLFQPTVSRSGNRLVAIELVNAHYRLVEVDLKSGKRITLLESPTESFIEPALSDDGSQIAFLALESDRAILETAPMPKYDFAYPIPKANVAKVVNDSGPILDVAYPAWTREGTVLFSSNERGRLEVWEQAAGSRKPVVSDPVGAFWAERTDRGVLYASYAATGYVLKMKPREDWGVVPDFAGPSAPGEIVSFGKLENDYPGFVPYPPAAEKKADTASAKRRAGATATQPASNTTQAKPAADAAPAILKRAGKGRTTDTVPTLQDEKPFTNIPTLKLWLPCVDFVRTSEHDVTFGAGALAVLTGFPLQGGAGMTLLSVSGLWYPAINQANAGIIALFPVYTGTAILDFERQFDRGKNGVYYESTGGTVSFSLPLRTRYFNDDVLDFALLAGGEVASGRSNNAVFGMADNIPSVIGLHGRLGLDIAFARDFTNEISLDARGMATAIVSSYSPLPSVPDGKAFISGDFDGAASAGTDKLRGELALRARWFDLPAEAPMPSTLANPRGETFDCLYPGRAILEAAVIIPNDGMNTRGFVERLASFGTNSAGQATPQNGEPLNLTIDPAWHVGAEWGFEMGRNRIAAGVSFALDPTTDFDFLADTRLYVIMKLDSRLISAQ